MKYSNIDLPPVDDGRIYFKIPTLVKKDGFNFDITEEILMTDLQNKVKEKFNKVATCVLNIPENFPKSTRKFISGKDWQGKIVDYIPEKDLLHKWSASNKDWVYCIVYDGRVVKVGMTSSGMAPRYNSYNTGTVDAMIKGSCATTNFVITQCNYHAILCGITVEIYAYEIPELIHEQVIFGKKQLVRSKIAYKYEEELINIVKEATGKQPVLCGFS